MSRQGPAFLIVGAAKSGTTSLYHYLYSHPEIFMPRLKEPGYFVSETVKSYAPDDARSEGAKKSTVMTEPEYLQLFADAGSGQVVGEATATYLYLHRESVPRIQALVPEADILMVLRNPVDRAYSAYTQLLRDGFETRTFEESLAMEKERIQQRYTPMFHYLRQGLYAAQVEDFLSNFKRVKVLLQDDLHADATGVVKQVCEFLNIDAGYRPDTGARFNVSGVPRFKWVYRQLVGDGMLRRMLVPILDAVIPPRVTAGVSERLKAGMMEKPGLDPELRRRLASYFSADLERLEALIGRDLSAWRSA